MNEIIEVDNTQNEYFDRETVTAKFSIPFFDFEKSKKEARIYFDNFCKANKNTDENSLRQLASEKLINDYSNKTANIGAGLCLFSIAPFIESFFSIGNIPVELAILTRYNMHLMVKLAVINGYPLSDDDFVDTLIRSARTHDIGATVARFFFRFIGTIPAIGQLISVFVGSPICAYINKKETWKFGRNILKEYSLDYEIINTFSIFSAIKKGFPWIIIIALLGYIYFYKNNEIKTNIFSNTNAKIVSSELIKSNNTLISSLQEITKTQKALLEEFKNNTKENNDKKFTTFYKMLEKNFIDINFYKNGDVDAMYDKESLIKELKKGNAEFTDNKKQKEIVILAYPIYKFGYYDSARGFEINYEYLIQQFNQYLSEQWISYLLLMQEQIKDLHNIQPNADEIDISFCMKWQNKLEVFLTTYPDFYLKEDIEKEIGTYKDNLQRMGY